MLKDLIAHQEWADAEHWRALLANPAALADEPVRVRLHHIHQVQHGFLWIVSGRAEAFTITTPAEYTPESLRDWGRAFHADMARLADTLDEARLNQQVSVPWFKDPPLTLTVREALTQQVMHSHYHRGQNATRLRELGGAPPLTDYIVWVWRGRPQPVWP